MGTTAQEFPDDAARHDFRSVPEDAPVNAITQLPARLRARAARLLTVLDGALWLGPTLAALFAFVLAAALLAVRVPETNPSFLGLELFVEGPSGAREALSAIVSATIAATSLVFTGTVVAVQLAAGQYSPRLLRDVLSDRGIQSVLSVLVGTVVYCLPVLRAVPDEGDLPLVATLVGFNLGFVVVGTLVFFLHHLLGLLRLGTVIQRVHDNTLAAIDGTHPQDAEDDVELEVPDDAARVPALRSGYVQAIGIQAMADAADEIGVHVRVRPNLGAYLVEGTTLAWVWKVSDGRPADDVIDEVVGRVDESIALGTERTLSEDVAYGIRHLVDIALRGVSPGVNDPTTAVQCIHVLTTVLVALARRPLVPRIARTGDSVVVVAQPSLAAYLSLAQSQILLYGGDDPHVLAALALQLRDLTEASGHADHDKVVREHADRIRERAGAVDLARHDAERVDAALSHVEDVLAGRADDDMAEEEAS